MRKPAILAAATLVLAACEAVPVAQPPILPAAPAPWVAPQEPRSRFGDERIDNMLLAWRIAQRLSVSPSLLSALAWVESRGNAQAMGGRGRYFGLMQVAPATAAIYGVPRASLLDPEANLIAGGSYLRAKLELHQGDERRAVEAYNQGVSKSAASAAKSAFVARVMQARKPFLRCEGKDDEACLVTVLSELFYLAKR
ncbi:MAG: lytic transglycosylase domain-containing protein [Alphaproteobacteria bacterium]|nr:lytic transglycosylase domain-containing protein [Alphaproteobacteria bacterium]